MVLYYPSRKHVRPRLNIETSVFFLRAGPNVPRKLAAKINLQYVDRQLNVPTSCYVHGLSVAGGADGAGQWMRGKGTGEGWGLFINCLVRNNKL